MVFKLLRDLVAVVVMMMMAFFNLASLGIRISDAEETPLGES
jgi:hypothetical protein